MMCEEVATTTAEIVTMTAEIATMTAATMTMIGGTAVATDVATTTIAETIGATTTTGVTTETAEIATVAAKIGMVTEQTGTGTGMTMTTTAVPDALTRTETGTPVGMVPREMTHLLIAARIPVVDEATVTQTSTNHPAAGRGTLPLENCESPTSCTNHTMCRR